MPATTIQIRAQDKTKQAFSAVQRSVSGLSKSFGSLKGSIAGLLGVAALGGLSKSLLTTADRIDKVSQQTGVATGDLQKFQFAASQSGVSTEGLNKSLQTLAKRAGEAQAEGGEMKAAFDRLNISLQNADGTSKNVTDLFYESAKAISLLESDTAKAAAANDLFGRSGVELLPLLNQGESGIRKYGKSIAEAGGIMSDKFVKGAAKTNDAIDKTTRVLKVGFTNVLEALLPTIEGFAKTLSKFSKDFKAFSETHPIVTKLALAVTALAIAFAALGGPLTAIVTGVVLLITNWEKLTSLFEGFDSKVKKMGLKQLREEQDRLNESVKNLEVPWFLKGSASGEVSLKKHSAKLKEQLNVIEKQIKVLETKEKLNKETNKTLGATSKLIIEDLENTKKGMLFSETTLQLDEKLYQVTLKDLEGKGQSLGVVKGLTKEQSEQLVGARQIARVQLAQEKSLKIAKNLTTEQKIEQARIKSLIGEGIAMNMTLSGFMMKILGSSKKVGKAWDGIWKLFGKAFDSLTAGWLDSTDNAEAYKKRMLEINNLIKEINTNIDDAVDSIYNITSEQKALAQIEKTYGKRKADSERLNATQLLHYAEQERIVAILAYRVGVLRNATAAFASSVQQFLDAVSTKGFTDLQKQFFSMVTGFTRSVLKDYTAVISAADAIIAKGDATAIKGRVAGLQTTAQTLGTFGPITSANLDKHKELFKTFWENFKSLEMDKTGAGKWFRERMAELSKLGGEAGIKARQKAMLEFSTMLSTSLKTVQAQITAYNEALETKTKTEALMTDATKGLTIMLKDTILSEFEAGKSIEHLKIDVNALSGEFLKAGVSLSDLLEYINTLTPKQHGGAVSAGRPYLVGEKGPEMFMPSRSGWITPNHQLASGGHDDIVVNIYDGTGQRISEYDSAIRVEMKDVTSRQGTLPPLNVS